MSLRCWLTRHDNTLYYTLCRDGDHMQVREYCARCHRDVVIRTRKIQSYRIG